jgi:formylglycine-generating enzyme required for sulfatase activity
MAKQKKKNSAAKKRNSKKRGLNAKITETPKLKSTRNRRDRQAASSVTDQASSSLSHNIQGQAPTLLDLPQPSNTNTIMLVSGDRRVHVFAKKQVTFGRQRRPENDICLRFLPRSTEHDDGSRAISRTHMALALARGGLAIIDKSGQGIDLNGDNVRGERVFTYRDTRVGVHIDLPSRLSSQSSLVMELMMFGRDPADPQFHSELDFDDVCFKAAGMQRSRLWQAAKGCGIEAARIRRLENLPDEEYVFLYRHATIGRESEDSVIAIPGLPASVKGDLRLLYTEGMFWLHACGNATIVVDGSNVTHACLIPLRFGQVLEINQVPIHVLEVAQLQLDEDPQPPPTDANCSAPPVVKTGKSHRQHLSARTSLTPVTTAGRTLSKADIKKVQGLLKAKEEGGVKLGLSLLISLRATPADYETVFTKTVIRSVLSRWHAESWGAVAKALVPHGAVSDLFQKLVAEKVDKAEERLSVDYALDITPLHYASIPVARQKFLASRGASPSTLREPFLGLVSIPAGSFTMGSPVDEASRGDDEAEVEVRITKMFEMGRTVVTQGQWRAVIGTDIKVEGWKWGYGDDLPAVGVSWDDAVLFCQALTSLERERGRLTASQAYRLPTEAEWEYACRAGTKTTYSFGEHPDQLPEYGWCSSNSDSLLHAVALKAPNPWGLFDMHGNVWEWCSDWYGDTLAGGNNPTGPCTGTSRVARGGTYRADASACRSACRCRRPWHFDGSVGFRVALG